ncbi:MAG: hypothetical protein NTY36_17875 [Deltaproteobacteria bacterium]|nr:hypothetical protein [Deltaproteobacteria bacterium]
MEDFQKIIREKKLPRVGQTVRSQKFGTLWRVMEKKEVWQNIDPDPQTGETRMVPAIYLSYWKIQDEAMPGVGKMMGFLYTLYDNTFELNWDIAP